MHAIHTPCKICVVADCLDILSYKLTFKGAGRQREKYGKYTRFTNTKRHRRILRVRGSYKELKKPSSTLKAESEDFCSKRIVTLCVSPPSSVELAGRRFLSFMLFLTDDARRLFTAEPLSPIARQGYTVFLEPAAAGQRALSIAAWFGFARWKNGVAVGLYSESDQGSVERNFTQLTNRPVRYASSSLAVIRKCVSQKRAGVCVLHLIWIRWRRYPFLRHHQPR